ncbi:MAG TPA: hypothetical protein VN203_14730, partial [Candidatus Acidoferrum sp.]|nr:hypothetical protein [Candidatus Acidoferrum sp.]
GYRPDPARGAREQFLEDYAAHTVRVRAIYNRVFGLWEGDISRPGDAGGAGSSSGSMTGGTPC